MRSNFTIEGPLSEDVASDDEITVDLGESSVFLLVILISKWILSPFVVTANVMTVVVVIKYIKKITPTHVVIAFLSFSGLLVGIIIHPFNLVLYLQETLSMQNTYVIF